MNDRAQKKGAAIAFDDSFFHFYNYRRHGKKFKTSRLTNFKHY